MDQDEKANGKTPVDAYAELRRLLLPEGEDLARLTVRVSDPQLRAEDVSEVLSPAIRIGAAHSPELRATLRPLLEEALRISVQKDPSLLADTLFPILAGSVRKSLAAAFRRTVQSLKRMGEQNFSWRSLRWRWEALKTGKPFADLVLTHSLLYRVEQVFLIHRETGLLLEQCGAETGLLTEVQDFLRDSFGNQSQEPLEILQTGGYEVWMQHGADAILAAVILGNAPHQFKAVLQHTLNRIHDSKAAELESFNGDPSPFLSCEEDLADCLLGQATEERRGLSPLWWLAVIILLEAIGYWIFTGVRENRRWDDYLVRMHSQPGIVVTSVDKHGSSYTVRGLRDPLAIDPATLLAGTGVDPKNVGFHWEPYHSLQPSFEAQRRITNETQAIESQTLHFGPGSADIAEEDIATINQIAARMKTLLLTGKNINRPMVIGLIGHLDGTKLEEQHDRLAQTRAEAVRNALIDAGVPEGALVARDAGASQPLRQGSSDIDKLFNRYVSFRVN